MRYRDGSGLARGFIQGYGFMDRMETNEQTRGLRDDRNERAAESHGLNMEIGQRKIDEYDRLDDARLISSVQQGLQSGQLDPVTANEFGKRFDVDWSNYVDPEFGNSLNTLEGAIAGKVRMNSPEFNSAFARVFNTEITKNTGEEIGAEGGKTWIKEKRLGGVYPSPDGKGLLVDLQVLEEGPNGEVWRNAPVTDNRSAKDEYAKAIPLEAALKKLKGHQLMFEQVQSSPQLQSLVSQLGARVGAPQPEARWGDPYQDPSLGTVQRGPNGEVKVIQGLSTQKPIVVNDRLVDPQSGKVIGNYSDPNGGSSSAPADVRTAEWMVSRGMAPNLDVAWNRINESRTDPAKFVSNFVEQELAVQQSSGLYPGAEGYRSTDELRQQAIESLQYIRAQTRGLEARPPEPSGPQQHTSSSGITFTVE
ncbi:hypothetical protein A3765_28545 [Oleiphilus sp. HI0130]|nr:hypothetical protein A3765_29980 [Oleiphilus sp. HI0130]KZZ72502.1 hypothetical protein A3765_28545 [Oleiphilus sp. HI0130]